MGDRVDIGQDLDIANRIYHIDRVNVGYGIYVNECLQLPPCKIAQGVNREKFAFCACISCYAYMPCI